MGFREPGTIELQYDNTTHVMGKVPHLENTNSKIVHWPWKERSFYILKSFRDKPHFLAKNWRKITSKFLIMGIDILKAFNLLFFLFMRG